MVGHSRNLQPLSGIQPKKEIKKVTIASIENLVKPIVEAGKLALDAQGRLGFGDRGFKDDGSVITTADPMVEAHLVRQIDALFPYANILAEETTRRFDADRPWTFALDPIDGTDAFSQGMAGWCVSLALLDGEMRPVAGIIHAPKLDLLLFADVGKPATINGEAVDISGRKEPLSKKSNIMVTSSIHRWLDLKRFEGKLRSIGSAALHLTGPVVYPGVFAAVDGGGGRIWDIAAAHAIVRSVGYDFERFSGGEVDYGVLVGGEPVGELVFSGSSDRIATLRTRLGMAKTNGA